MFAEIQGVIEACVRLSGMPDLTLSFMVCILHFHCLFLERGDLLKSDLPVGEQSDPNCANVFVNRIPVSLTM